MYHVYTTPAIVCGAYDNGVADRTVLLFTRDAGMIFASVKSVREERSKHRYTLTEFSLLTASLVQGKSGWRIVGSEPIMNVYTNLTTRASRAYVRNILRFIKRMVRGEEVVDGLFDCVESALRSVATMQYTDDMTRAEREVFYHMCVLLGYLPKQDVSLLTTDMIEKEVAHAIAASHL